MAFVNPPLSLPVDRQDTTSPADKREVERSEQLLKDQFEDQVFQSRQRGQEYSVTKQSIRDLRQFLHVKTQLSDKQVDQLLKNHFESGPGKDCPGHDSPDVQTELRAEPPAVAATPRDEGNTGGRNRDSYRSTDGQNEARQTARGNTASSGTPQSSTQSSAPPRTAVAQQKQALQAATTQAPQVQAQPKTVATAVVKKDASLAPERKLLSQPGQPPSPTGQPVVATKIVPLAVDGNPAPETPPAPQPGVYVITDDGLPPHVDLKNYTCGLERQAKLGVLTRPPTASFVASAEGTVPLRDLWKSSSSGDRGSKIGFPRTGDLTALVQRGRRNFSGGPGGCA